MRTEQWRRLLIALNDLTESEEYIRAHYEFGNLPRYSEAWGELGLEMAERMDDALISCGLIAYARPFVQSRGGGWTKVPDRFTSSYTKEERECHNYVLEARKKLIAHSDTEGMQTLARTGEDGMVIMSVRPVPIVMIPGEDDSMSLDEAAQKSEPMTRTTFEEFGRLVEDAPVEDRPSSVLLRETRQFDVANEVCMMLLSMIEKVTDAIKKDLGLSRP